MMKLSVKGKLAVVAMESVSKVEELEVTFGDTETQCTERCVIVYFKSQGREKAVTLNTHDRVGLVNQGRVIVYDDEAASKMLYGEDFRRMGGLSTDASKSVLVPTPGLWKMLQCIPSLETLVMEAN